MESVLFHPGWIEFNEAKWGLTAKRLVAGNPEAGSAHGLQLVYLNRRQHIRMARLNYYSPVDFRPTSTEKPHRLERQWLEISSELAEAMGELGVSGAITLEPGVRDVRMWQWHGFRAEPRYTYRLEFPYSLATSSSAVGKHTRKAGRLGYSCERTQAWADVVGCLYASEARQRFEHHITPVDLARLSATMGDEHFRAYVCLDSHGRPVSAEIALHQPGTMAMAWVAGTMAENLSAGASTFLKLHILADLEASDATGYDFCGANLQRLAAAKAEWGGELSQYFAVMPTGPVSLARDAKHWVLDSAHIGQRLRGLRVRRHDANAT